MTTPTEPHYIKLYEDEPTGNTWQYASAIEQLSDAAYNKYRHDYQYSELDFEPYVAQQLAEVSRSIQKQILERWLKDVKG